MYKYLELFFNFETDKKDHKDLLFSSLQSMLKAVDSLQINPRNKPLLYDRYVVSSPGIRK